MPNIRFISVAVALALLPAAAADLSLGTWERNVKKSKSSGPDPWKRQTVLREAAPGGAKITVTAEMKNGQKLQLSWTARYDGSPVLVEGAPAGWDTLITRQIDDRHFTSETYDSRGGRYHVKGRTVISKDGKRSTSWDEGIGVKGNPIKFKVVYDRVQ